MTEMLSRYISLVEFERSQTATRRGIKNKMVQSEKDRAITLSIRVLDKIREHYNRPLIITSGFRGRFLNQLIGGSRTSQHMHGEAADFYIVGIGIEQLFTDIITGKIPNLEYDQVIHEGSWVHISYRGGNNRHQKLCAEFAEDGSVTYHNA